MQKFAAARNSNTRFRSAQNLHAGKMPQRRYRYRRNSKRRRSHERTMPALSTGAAATA
ncbi:MAG: hypothetical protein ACREOO_01300 [bacterium]